VSNHFVIAASSSFLASSIVHMMQSAVRRFVPVPFSDPIAFPISQITLSRTN
jgi:hypothetical protein